MVKMANRVKIEKLRSEVSLLKKMLKVRSESNLRSKMEVIILKTQLPETVTSHKQPPLLETIVVQKIIKKWCK